MEMWSHRKTAPIRSCWRTRPTAGSVQFVMGLTMERLVTTQPAIRLTVATRTFMKLLLFLLSLQGLDRAPRLIWFGFRESTSTPRTPLIFSIGLVQPRQLLRTL